MTRIAPPRLVLPTVTAFLLLGTFDFEGIALSQSVPPIITPAQDESSSRRKISSQQMRQVPQSQSNRQVPGPVVVAAGETYESLLEPIVVSQHESAASGILPDLNISYPESINLNLQAGIVIKLTAGASAQTSACRLTVSLPDHLELIGTSPEASSRNQNQLDFDVPAISSSNACEIYLDIIAREKKPITLDSKLTIVRNKSVEVAVRQPVLEMELVGPSEGILGEPHNLEIVIKNTGDGVASQLQIESKLSDGYVIDEQALARLAQAGTLEPGESVRVPLAARLIQEGNQRVGIRAKALGAEEISRNMDLNVLKPTLEISATAPREIWVNSRAWFTLKVVNPGKVELQNCRVALQVPSMEVQTISEDVAIDEVRQTLNWEIGVLAPGQEASVQMIAIAKAAGPHLINAVLSSDSTEPRELAFDTLAMTKPSLTVAVSQAELPAPVGVPSGYKVVLANNGTELAEFVAVRVRLPEGWSAENSGHCEFSDGVATLTFESVPAGGQATLEFQAMGNRSGESVFRASVQHGDTHYANTSETTMFLMETKNYRVSEISEPRLVR